VGAEATQRLTGEEELAGEVSSVVFTNEGSGFGVVEVTRGTGSGPRGAYRAAGPLAGLVEGQSVRLVGRWTEHERYGPTFEAAYYEQAQPRSVAGLVAFLASERFPRVGTTLAQRLVTAFGLDLAAVVEKEPERLASVRGVSAELAAGIAAAWRQAGALAALVERLGAVGVPPAVAAAAQRWLGEDALERLEEDPYALLEVRGATWTHAEALARAAGLPPDDARRLVAGAVTAQREVCAAGGHTAADTRTLVPAVRRLLGTDREGTEQALRRPGRRGWGGRPRSSPRTRS
jgi:exodeoxyribonuclease V alpha subunit